MAALLTSIMETYRTAIEIEECRNMGINIILQILMNLWHFYSGDGWH